MRYFIKVIILCCIFLPDIVVAQKVINLERYGKAKTQRFRIGQTLTYRILQYSEWHTEVIADIKPNDSLIIFENSILKSNQITALQFYRPVANVAGISLSTFGFSWILFGLVGQTFEKEKFTWGQASFGVGAIATGWLVRKLFYRKNIGIDAKNRLRLLDLTFYPK